MRILHTSDWHLGHVLHEVSREREHALFLEWLLALLDEESVDALLVAGDLFDAANPPAEAQRAFFRFVAAARRRRPRLEMVFIGGNHDSAGRLDAPDPILAALDVHMVGGLPRAGGKLDLERVLVPLRGPAGAIEAWVAAVPYLRPADLPLQPGEGIDPLVEGVRALYSEILEAARARRAPGQALVAMGHCYMTGTRLSELSERKVLAGNEHALPVDLFPDDLTYGALGHLHLAQTVGKRTNVRYSGSPIPLALDESSYPHQVLVVDLDGDRFAGARSIRVPRTLEFLLVPDDRRPTPLEAVLAELSRLPERDGRPEAERPLVEARVLVEGPQPGIREKLDAALQGKLPRLVKATIVRAKKDGGGAGEGVGGGGAAEPACERLPDLRPEELFRRKHRDDYGEYPSLELLRAFAELEEAVRQEDGG
ncbi:MAG: exonuclease subunit SbcD [Planctomycetes bacterium]|nr:exonuclease subunit SbcD [Planctomycetota bacterium]